MAKAGLAGANFHDLRRANATTLVADGVDVKTAQTPLRPSSGTVTPGRPCPSTPEPDRVAADAFGRAYSQTPAQRSRTNRAWGTDTR